MSLEVQPELDPQMKDITLRMDLLSAQLTRFEEHYDSLDISNLTSADIIQLQLRLKVIEPLLSQTLEYQTAYNLLSQKANLDIRLDISNLEGEYFLILGKVQATINDFNNNHATNNTQTQRSTSSQQGRLASLDIPYFDGNTQNWLEFKDMFKALVIEDKSLADVTRLYYLRAYTKGEASKIISTYPLTNENFSISWDILCSRFENKKVIVNTHIQAILDILPVSKESPGALRQLSDNLTKHLHILEKLGQPVKHWDSLIIHVVSNKLDSQTRRSFFEAKTEGELPTMEEFKVFLGKRCELLEKLQPNSQSTIQSFQAKKPTFLTKVKREPTSSQSQSYSVTTGSCPVCANNHPIYACSSFLQLAINSRISKTKQLNLCLNCLKSNHHVRDCKSTSTCRTCHKKHNTLLHISNSSSGSTPEPVVQTNRAAQSSITHNPDNVEPTEIISSNHSYLTNIQVFLSTAVVKVFDSHGQTQACRVLLDSGSQGNFITSELSEKLQLPKTKVNTSQWYHINCVH